MAITNEPVCIPYGYHLVGDKLHKSLRAPFRCIVCNDEYTRLDLRQIKKSKMEFLFDESMMKFLCHNCIRHDKESADVLKDYPEEVNTYADLRHTIETFWH